MKTIFGGILAIGMAILVALTGVASAGTYYTDLPRFTDLVSEYDSVSNSAPVGTMDYRRLSGYETGYTLNHPSSDSNVGYDSDLEIVSKYYTRQAYVVKDGVGKIVTYEVGRRPGKSVNSAVSKQTCTVYIVGDVDGDGVFDFTDLDKLVYGASCSPWGCPWCGYFRGGYNQITKTICVWGVV